MDSSVAARKLSADGITEEEKMILASDSKGLGTYQLKVNKVCSETETDILSSLNIQRGERPFLVFILFIRND